MWIEEDHCFYWELMLIGRKILMMAAFLFFSDSVEQAWFLGSAVVIVALIAHSAAGPYEDARIDWCEFMSLVSTLFICQAGVVFKVINDPANPDSTSTAQTLSASLEMASVLLVIANSGGAVYVEWRMMMLLREASADSDYKEDLVAEKITQNREELAGLEEAMRKAQDAKAEWLKKKAAKLALAGKEPAEERTPQMVTKNPLADDPGAAGSGGSDEEGED